MEGNAAYSVMANTLRGIYGADVLIAARKQLYWKCAESRVYRKNGGKHDHAKWSFWLTVCKMDGAQLKETVRNFYRRLSGRLPYV